MKNVRLNLTNDEQIAQNVLGNSDYLNFNMSEGTVQEMIQKEKTEKFNEELDAYINKFEEHRKELYEISDKMGANPEKLEIKPMKDHMLIKPFEQNPFQKMTVKNGLIVDTGGFQANVDKNPMTGKYEEQVQVILTGCIIEVGPEVRYIQPGDVVFYHRRNAIPVPFFKQGLYDIGEYHVLAVVNEELTKRFNRVSNGN